RDNIVKAKGEIFAGLDHDGVAVINADDAYDEYWCGLNASRKIVTFGIEINADVSAQHVENNGLGIMSLSTPNGKNSVVLHLQGKHNISNALAASAVAYALGVSNAEIAYGLEHFAGVNGRLQRKAGLNHAVVIDDTYNANPDSMRAAIDVLAIQAGTKILVIGDMGELGVDALKLHAEIGAYAKQKGIDVFYTLGENSQAAAQAFGAKAQAFNEVDMLVNTIKNEMNQKSVVLVKGSRFMKMERVVNAITTQQNNGEAH
ncbi:MAG: UDP-N-acetylmuramoyl-tripeptide--D-alanyl-D-alanine ligase, partial [Methylotenera sp.]|nr:UDP-N-acetylmuramoyl-tripeptide--D-alanyl-D-alanine ligase [Methylotenera sp.]